MSSVVPRVLFVIPYFGRWPFWMPFFLESCRHNPDIDWLLFSDCGALPNCPPNVTLETISFDGYCRHVSSRLGIPFAPGQPYKLCDIKPALGHIHQDRLVGYDFWAFGDVDVIYGDLRAYFTNERLRRVNVVSTHARRVAGHLCLMRNIPRKRKLFMQVENWRGVFLDSQHHAFDEKAFSRLFIRHKHLPKPLFKLLNQLNPLHRRSEFTEAYSTPNGCIAWHDGQDRFPRQWRWHRGQLSNDLDGDRGFPYFHFACWKRAEWSRRPEPNPGWVHELAQSPTWLIDDRGFHQDTL